MLRCDFFAWVESGAREAGGEPAHSGGSLRSRERLDSSQLDSKIEEGVCLVRALGVGGWMSSATSASVPSPQPLSP